MKPIKSDKFLHIVASTPLVSIDLVIRNERGLVLLGYRTNNPAKGCWFVPGGIIRKNERLDSAFNRIFKNEIGLIHNRDDSKFLGVFEHYYPENFLEVDNVDTHYVVLAHEICIADNVKVLGDDQHSELRWWSVCDLLANPSVHKNTKAYFDLL